jgi:ABC-type transport system involved in cytochrome bd biosynthesis fused ATPase/permease subunit
MLHVGHDVRSARLAVLDEPFRGLDRERRRVLLERARQVWRGATMLCVTHDVTETLGFDRVLVVEEGRLVEQGAPAQLARSNGRYAALLRADEAVRRDLWSASSWKRLRMETGQLGSAEDAEPR